MQYREIVAITGLGGLFQLVASKQDGAIVRSLEDKVTRFVSSRIHNFTPLESIEVFTTGDNVNLASVFKAMQENEAKFPLIEAKSDNNAIKSYFKNVFPEFDEERVYVSDMKKMIKWFGILKTNDLLIFEEALAEEEEAPVEEAAQVVEASKATEEVKEAKPKAKAKAKAKTATEGEDAPKEAKPKKATKAKKEAGTDDAKEAPAKPKTTRKKKSGE